MIDRTSPPVARARGVLAPARWSDHELVGGKDELGAHPGPCYRRRRAEQAYPTLMLRRLGSLGAEGGDGVPSLRRGDQRWTCLGSQVHAEVARAPQLAHVRIASLRLGAIVHVLEARAVQGEGGVLTIDLEAQG